MRTQFTSVRPPWESHPGCGCEQGGIGLLLGVAGYLAFLFLRPGGWQDAGWREFWIGAGIVFLTTSLGKLVGIVLARRAGHA